MKAAACRPVPGALPRAAAVRALRRILHRRTALDPALAAENQGLTDPRDRALCQRLVYGALRDWAALDWLARRLIDRPPAKRQDEIRTLLAVGLQQLWRESMPEHAVVHSTVAAADLLGIPRAKSLINACLRRWLREREAHLASLATDDARYGLPTAWRQRLAADWPADWPAICDAQQQPPPLALRINLSRLTRVDYLGRLEAAGLPALPLDPHWPESAVLLAAPVPVERLPGFAEGWVSVQDAAAQFAPQALALKPGLRVLDACAAPGGKTAHLCEATGGRIELTAVERDAWRAARLGENLERVQCACEVRVADAACPTAWWDGRPFDRILLDAPCSASGVVRRHPDIPWRRDAAGLARVQAAQAALLAALWPLLKPGGMLVYVTCSLYDAENDRQIEALLAGGAPLAVSPLPDWGRARCYGRQFLPGEHGMDGFYYARLERHLAPDPA